MEVGASLPLITKLEVFIQAASIALARMGGLFIVMPVFLRAGLTGILRAGVAIAFALPIIPFIADSFPFAEITGPLRYAILFKEFMVGVILGFVIAIPFWAAEAAGEILDLQRGLNFADIADPSSTENNNITGSLFALIAVALYFASGGLNLTMNVVYGSYQIWPIAEFLPLFSQQAGLLFLTMLDDILAMGLMLILPMSMALLLSDLCLALVARAAPHMNIFILSLAVKNLVFALLIALYSVFLIGYMRDDLVWIITAPNKLEQISSPR
ncbi:MAG: type III secretion system export apparatus subunit SctT [Rhodomicrobium sp.]|nr:type III secretion system export apparatus subunit SctT [Rhodomicrobium sp.]